MFAEVVCFGHGQVNFVLSSLFFEQGAGRQVRVAISDTGGAESDGKTEAAGVCY